MRQSEGAEVKKIVDALRSLGDPVHAEQAQRFFKTGKGEYAEGDVFLGIRVPVLRKQLKAHRLLPLESVCQLLLSRYHEVRLFALLLMVEAFKRGNQQERKNIYQAYLQHSASINNWDLVDSSAHHIVGAYLTDRDKRILHQLAQSPVLWERRIAMIACFHDIKRGEFTEALRIAGRLLGDEHDLMHKAVGWMLREIGKRDMAVERAFLDQHYSRMPRTMLRYAIEHFPESLRQRYLQGKV